MKKTIHSLLIVTSVFLLLTGNAYASQIARSLIDLHDELVLIVTSVFLLLTGNAYASQIARSLIDLHDELVGHIVKQGIQNGDVSIGARLSLTAKPVKSQITKSGAAASAELKSVYQYNKPFRGFLKNHDASGIKAMPSSDNDLYLLCITGDRDTHRVVTNFMRRYPGKKLGHLKDEVGDIAITFGGFERELNQAAAVEEARNILKNEKSLGMAILLNLPDSVVNQLTRSVDNLPAQDKNLLTRFIENPQKFSLIKTFPTPDESITYDDFLESLRAH